MSQAKFKVKKGDTVAVIAGKDKGKRGEVIRVIPSEARLVVAGVNLIKRHNKATMYQAGGIEQREAPIHISNVMHIDPETDKPCRVGYKETDKGVKVRFAKGSGKVLDS